MGKPVKYTYSYVYVVLEHAYDDWEGDGTPQDAKIHGVYINKEEALGKAAKLHKTAQGYLCILKKPLRGKSVNFWSDWE